MLRKCCTQYASKLGKLSSGLRTGKGQFSFQTLGKAMPKIVQTTAQLHIYHMLALLIVMLPKAHLTSHSRMSGSRWVNTPSWLSGSWRSSLCSSSVYTCHLFLISSASVRSIPFLFYWSHLSWNVLLVSLIFLKRSLVFPIQFFSSTSLHYSLKKAFLSLLAILWNSAVKLGYLMSKRSPWLGGIEQSLGGHQWGSWEKAILIMGKLNQLMMISAWNTNQVDKTTYK